MIKKIQDVTTGSLGHHLLTMAWPSSLGMLAIILFNVTDTFFVSKLGTSALAAMGFTMPVILTVGGMAIGFGMGAASIISRAFGENDHKKATRAATDGLVFSIGSTLVLGGLGYFFCKPLFSMLGAEGETLVLVQQYMNIWFLGSVFCVMPALSNGCMRAVGEMKLPLVVMLLCGGLNALLDYGFIFGNWGFPNLGVRGAAIATIIARAVSAVLSLYLLHAHYHLIGFKGATLRQVVHSWKEILRLGIPAGISQLLGPVSVAIYTKLGAYVGGVVTVAGITAGSRIEMFANVIPIGVSIALFPIFGQNWGAKKAGRIAELRRLLIVTAIGLGAVAAFVFFVFPHQLVRVFSDQPGVIKMGALYLVACGFGHGPRYYSDWVTNALNAIGETSCALRLNVLRLFVLGIPVTVIGTYFGGVAGLVFCIAFSQWLGAFYSYYIARKKLQLKELGS